jgi:hypothetical protein
VLRLTDSMQRQVGPRRGDRFAVRAYNGHEYLNLCIAGYRMPKSVELRFEPLPLLGALKPSSASCASRSGRVERRPSADEDP